MSFEKIYTRVPKSVYALQWLPFARLPSVQNIMGEVVEASASTYMGSSYNASDPFQPPRRPRLTCIGATVKIGEEDKEVQPHDYVIYSCETQQPIAVIAERVFSSIYVDSSIFSLCKDCSEKVKGLSTSSELPKNAEGIINILRAGGYVDVKDDITGTAIRISTIDEFKAYAAKKYGKVL
jgi:hypothetical protein